MASSTYGKENLARKLDPREVEELRQDAWIGDAVLELYARLRTLREHEKRDIDKKVSFTCNAFLNSIGQPTRVEGEIGRHYAKGGLPAAFEWIEANLEPHFLKQEAKRRRSQRT